MNEREQKLQEMLYKLPRMTREGQQWVPLDEVLKLAHGNAWQAAPQYCTLAECPAGLFLFNGRLGFKSEYGNDEVFCADSGEVFWGGTSTYEKRAALLVQPISESALLRQAVPAKAAPSSSEAALREAVEKVITLIQQSINSFIGSGHYVLTYSHIIEELNAALANSQPVRGAKADAPTAASEQVEGKP